MRLSNVLPCLWLFFRLSLLFSSITLCTVKRFDGYSRHHSLPLCPAHKSVGVSRVFSGIVQYSPPPPRPIQQPPTNWRSSPTTIQTRRQGPNERTDEQTKRRLF